MTDEERLWWMVLVEAESYSQSRTSADDELLLPALEIAAEARGVLRDRFGLNLDELGVAAQDAFEALLKKKQEARNKRTSMERFHLHLDACERCEKQPFNLCPTGQQLLEKTAASDGK